MDVHSLIDRERAKLPTHIVVTHYSDGTAKSHATRNAAAATDLESAKARVLAAADNPPAEYGETVGNYHYWIAAAENDGLTSEDFEELKTLRALAAEGETSPDWTYGETLVRDSYFEEYAQQLADECCPWPSGSREAKALEQWPYRCIDWEQAARELKQDYTAVEFDDVTYWVRS